ncbi:MAG: two-component system response regulator CreB [Deltaproteobacteria bacterium]|nr:two-component system response regulator CreB [Deltaproteobacteria bacterium]
MKRILVVEDEPTIVDSVQYALKTEGFEVTVCGTGSAALALLGTDPFDLVVLDVGLPDIGGFEVCKQIRKTSTIPVLFLTARSDEIDRVVGLELGADDYVVKPFSPRELSARVRAILRRVDERHGATVATQNVTPFLVDHGRLEVTYFGKRLELTRYEFKLLALLIASPGRVFTRDQIMGHVWDEPDSSMERTVDSHVKTIRSQLRSIRPEVDPIITHRGTGYALKEDW